MTKLCSVATECVSSLATDSILQMELFKSDALWHLLLFMFNYDYTLEEGGVERTQDENRQEVANNLAKLAVKACARLGGYMTGENKTPNNPVTVNALEKLLTPYLARQLSKDKPEEILKTLNSNCSNPYLIWDNGTRAELNEYLEAKRLERLNGNENFEHDFSNFKYSAHAGELIIGEIFVKVYNEQPVFPIEVKLSILFLYCFLLCFYHKFYYYILFIRIHLIISLQYFSGSKKLYNKFARVSVEIIGLFSFSWKCYFRQGI